MNLFKIVLPVVIACLFCMHVQAQRKKADSTVYVDKSGVMRWKGSNKEVQGFGVNYTVPFAYGYRAAKELGVDIEKAIDADVYHFARLGFDAYRVHVWDTEISDTLGNLIDNEHLRLFDYLLSRMKQRGMRFLITPIAYWGNGWPAPDENTPGFSHKYGKDKCLTDTGAIRAQQNYLYQFLNHVNRYTGVAYKDDPGIIAFEVSNEPHHHEAPEKVTAFIKGMIASMRKTGCKKPVFYNISHSIHLEDAYFNAGIDGGTFQWYPTGLGFKQELQGNLLSNVDDYLIPFADNAGFKKIAKVVYEFDAADVGRSYIYPAMARSFRTAGIQWATHFAYDPTYTAYANTEYDTHYMNLVYAPQKALSLMIAGEVFHRMPMYKSYGAYPADTSFDGFHVSYRDDLAELVTPQKFIYTNNTSATPPIDALEQIAGSGNSVVVQYDGTGAYFLDKIKEGVWRLEVMPDAIWINDPFGRNSLRKTVAVVNWQKHKIRIQTPALGSEFSIKGINDGNSFASVATDASFSITPGTYLLVKPGVNASYTGNESFRNITLKEFAAPATTLDKTCVMHEPLLTADAGNDMTVNAVIATVKDPEAVELHVWSGWRPVVIPMQKKHGYTYTATVPSKSISEGFLRYVIAVKENGSFKTYPSGTVTYPGDWDYFDAAVYKVPVVTKTAPLYLFDAYNDANAVSRKWLPTSKVVPSGEPGKATLQLNIEKLFEADPENPNALPVNDYSIRFVFANNIAGRKGELAGKKKLVLHGAALNNKPCTVQLALITSDGVAYGGIVKIDIGNGDYSIDITGLRAVKTVLLPRPYPSFLSYYFESAGGTFDLQKIETLQFSIGPGIDMGELKEKHGVSIESVRLE